MKFSEEMHHVAEVKKYKDNIEVERRYMLVRNEILKDVKSAICFYAEQGFFNTKISFDYLYNECNVERDYVRLVRNDLENEGFVVTITDSHDLILGW